MKVKDWIGAVKGEKWCRWLTLAMRLVVGGVFIFSGFVKAVDPWGTCYKLTDYLNAMGLQQWSGVALVAAVALAALEFMLGVAVVAGAYRRGAPWLMLLLLLVMTPLTLWLAVTGAVQDCGCFGDALHLSNWATFGKNVLLLLGVVWLIVFNRCLPCVYGPAVQWVLMALSFGLVAIVAYHGYLTQPLIDYRPYPVGTRLTAATTLAGDADDEEDADDFTFVYRKDGVEHNFTIDSLPDEEDGWEFVTRYHANRPRGKVIMQQGDHNAITVTDGDGEDITADVMDGRRQLLLLFPDLPQVSIAHSFVLNELTEIAQVDDADAIGLTSASQQEIAEWQDVSMAEYPLYNMDDSEIKMLARGNPAVVYVEDGAIVWKRTLTSLDVPADGGVTLRELDGDRDDDATMTSLMLAYLASLLILLVVNRTHVLAGRLLRRKSKKQHPTTTSD